MISWRVLLTKCSVVVGRIRSPKALRYAIFVAALAVFILAGANMGAASPSTTVFDLITLTAVVITAPVSRETLETVQQHSWLWLTLLLCVPLGSVTWYLVGPGLFGQVVSLVVFGSGILAAASTELVGREVEPELTDRA